MRIASAWTLFTLWALIYLSCSPVGASDAQRSATSNGETTPEKELEGLVKTREITDGSFRLLTIGESKDEVLVDLRKMGVARIKPGLGEQVAATTAEDLLKLQNAEGLIIGAGDVTITFDGNDVQRVAVAPVFPEWNALLHGVRTKKEAFRAVAQILERSKGVEVRALAVDADDVWINRMTPEGQALLDKYDHWSVAYDAEDGYVHMDLDFAQGALCKIWVLESPTAL